MSIWVASTLELQWHGSINVSCFFMVLSSVLLSVHLETRLLEHMVVLFICFGAPPLYHRGSILHSHNSVQVPALLPPCYHLSLSFLLTYLASMWGSLNLGFAFFWPEWCFIMRLDFMAVLPKFCWVASECVARRPFISFTLPHTWALASDVRGFLIS